MDLSKVKHLDLAKAPEGAALRGGTRIRSQMPQIPDPAALVQAARKAGIAVRKGSRPADSLTPTQKHFKTDKVKKMVEAIKANESGMKRPILVAEGKIIDGHHRWAAYRMISPKSEVAVIELMTSPEEVIRMANRLGARTAKLAAAFLKESNYLRQAPAGPGPGIRAQVPGRSEQSSANLDDVPSRFSIRGRDKLKSMLSPPPPVTGPHWFDDQKRRRAQSKAEVIRRYGDGKLTGWDDPEI